MRRPTATLDTQIASGLERIVTLYRATVQKRATRLHLTSLQIQILMTLESYPQGISLGGLSRHLNLTPATLCDAIITLRKKGIAEKKVRDKDKRSALFMLHPKGILLAKSFSEWTRIVKEGTRLMNGEEKGFFLTSLIRMIEAWAQDGTLAIARMCVRCNHFRRAVHPGEAKPHHCLYTDRPLEEPDLKTDCRCFREIQKEP